MQEPIDALKAEAIWRGLTALHSACHHAAGRALPASARPIPITAPLGTVMKAVRPSCEAIVAARNVAIARS